MYSRRLVGFLTPFEGGIVSPEEARNRRRALFHKSFEELLLPLIQFGPSGYQ